MILGLNPKSENLKSEISKQWFVDNNKLDSLQLREQHRI